jgi:hypothetical protein
MNFKDIEKGIAQAIENGISDDATIITTGAQLNEIAGKNKYKHDSYYLLKKNSITEIDIEDIP